MLDLLDGGVVGSFLGGAFRLVPEVLKHLDRKNERKHELAMFEHQVDLEKTKGQIKLDEIGAQHSMAVDVGSMDIFKSAIESQTQMAVAAGGWAASLSASVRPLLTYWVWTLYSVAFFVLLSVTWTVTRNPEQLAKLVLTPDFISLMSAMTFYWFLDRTVLKGK